MPGLWAVGGDKQSLAACGSGGLHWHATGETIDDAAGLARMETELRRLAARAGVDQPDAIAHDLHPGSLTARWAKDRPEKKIGVQHHHAHALAAMDPNPESPALAAVFDGTGYGDDGTVWGGEILAVTPGGARQLGSLGLLPLAGGDLAITDPYRLLAGYAAALKLPLAVPRDPTTRAAIRGQVEAGINAPLTSSVGRLFDAVAALLELAPPESRDGAAARALQAAAMTVTETVPLPVEWSAAIPRRLHLRPLCTELLAARERGVPIPVLARSFHQWLADAVAEFPACSAAATGIARVVLAGGVWHNTLLRELTAARLAERGLPPDPPGAIPFDDRGLAVGQLIAAQHALKKER